MGANPMQKMKRNSILIGLIIGLIVGLIMCACLYLFMSKSGGSSITNKDGSITVCILNRNIKAGTTITTSDFTQKKVSKDQVPSDAVTISKEVIAKIDLSSGTILANGMLNATSENITADVREQEYNMITLPTELTKGDFIDIRLQLPNGGDYIVVSKKEVLRCNSSTVWLNMNEEETSIMSNAIVEYYIMTGSKLYATTYVEAGLQTAAVGTYVPNKAVSDLISSNPNLKNGINAGRYTDELKNIRNNNINAALSKYNETALDNMEEKVQEEIKSLKESREAYFGTLNSVN